MYSVSQCHLWLTLVCVVAIVTTSRVVTTCRCYGYRCACVVAAMVQQIIERAKEIEDLLAEVLEKERLKKEEEEEEKRRQEQQQLALEEPVVVSPPATETMSSPRVASPDDHDTIDQQVEDEVDRHFGPRDIPSKKKRRNVFARMIHAVRKRFAHRQRS